jgi:hypothetical protein
VDNRASSSSVTPGTTGPLHPQSHTRDNRASSSSKSNQGQQSLFILKVKPGTTEPLHPQSQTRNNRASSSSKPHQGQRDLFIFKVKPGTTGPLHPQSHTRYNRALHPHSPHLPVTRLRSSLRVLRNSSIPTAGVTYCIIHWENSDVSWKEKVSRVISRHYSGIRLQELQKPPWLRLEEGIIWIKVARVIPFYIRNSTRHNGFAFLLVPMIAIPIIHLSFTSSFQNHRLRELGRWYKN